MIILAIYILTKVLLKFCRIKVRFLVNNFFYVNKKFNVLILNKKIYE